MIPELLFDLFHLSTPDFVPFQTSGRSDKAPMHHSVSTTWHMCTNAEIPVDGCKVSQHATASENWQEAGCQGVTSATTAARCRSGIHRIYTYCFQSDKSHHVVKDASGCDDSAVVVTTGTAALSELMTWDKKSILHFPYLVHFFRLCKVQSPNWHQSAPSNSNISVSWNMSGRSN